jgi:hypothetical protein
VFGEAAAGQGRSRGGRDGTAVPSAWLASTVHAAQALTLETIRVGDWWTQDIVESGKLPLLLTTISFIVTFIVTRVIVRLIRAGKGPFTDNSVGGVHLHHVVPGIVLMLVGGLVAIGAQQDGWQSVAGIVFGAGAALVLDEFALVLHLDDVYWEEQGRLSVDVVFVLAGIMIVLLTLGSPIGVEEQTDNEVTTRVSLMAGLFVNVATAIVAALKGKLGTAVIGVFVPFVAYVGAVRIARPDSPWARRRYEGNTHKLVKSQLREVRFDTRWRSKFDWIQDIVAGTPTGESR